MRFIASALGCALVIPVTASHAQEDRALEVIIVTAQRRVETAQEVPISISVVDGDTMNAAAVTELRDVSSYVPNFTLNETGITTTVTIRGISSGINQAFEQSAGMYVDGVYYGRGQLARMPLFDMTRIEVARGPQPILFGKNSIAGAISMITEKPTETFEGSLSATMGDHGEQNFLTVLSGPLTDTFRGRLSIYDREFDGYMTNVFLGRDEKQEDETSVRASLAWDPADRITVDFKAEHSAFDTIGRNIEMVHSVALPSGGVDYITALSGAVALYNGAVAAGTAPPPPIPYLASDGILNHVKSSGPDEHSNEVDNLTLNIDYQLGNDYLLTFLTGLVEYDYLQLCDCDFVSAPLIDGTTQGEDFDQISQEIRLASPGGEKLDYVVGLYFQSNDLTYDDKINVPPDGVLRVLNAAFANIDTRRRLTQASDLFAVFAQATWNMSDRFRLTFGGRYTSEEKEATRTQVHHAGGVALPATDPSGMTPNALWGVNPLFGAFLIEPYDSIAGRRKESKFTPLLTAEWDVSSQAMVYATYVTGFKAGGFDARSNGHPDPAVANALNVLATPPVDIVGVFEYEDEEAESFELGAKVTLGDGRKEINAAIYATDYDDLQTSVFDGTLGFNVANASKASIQGLELDSRWALGDNWRLSASLAYLDFEFDDFRLAQCYFNDPRPSTGPGTCDATGNRREYTPEWTASLIADYERPIAGNLIFTAVAEVFFSDDYIWSPTLDPIATQDAFTKFNLRLSVGSAEGTWELALLGRNLTDETVSNFGGNATLARPLTGGTGNAYYTFVDRPRSVALQASYRFGAR